MCPTIGMPRYGPRTLGGGGKGEGTAPWYGEAAHEVWLECGMQFGTPFTEEKKKGGGEGEKPRDDDGTPLSATLHYI